MAKYATSTWDSFCIPFYAFGGNHGYFQVANLQDWGGGRGANRLNFVIIDSMPHTAIHIRDENFSNM